MADPVIPQETVARILGISRDTVRSLRKAGKLKAVQLSARRVGVRKSEVARYILDREGA